MGVVTDFMKVYQKERLENAICFFAREHFKHTRRPPSQTVLYKYLAFFDFQMLEATGDAPLDLEYLAMERGPVPIKLYRERARIKSNLFRFEEKGENKYVVRALKQPDLDYFSETEKQKMEELVFIFAQRYTDAQLMSDASHQKLRAWKEAYSVRPNSLIEKAATFRDSAEKSDDQLTPAEEHFRISEALRKAGT